MAELLTRGCLCLLPTGPDTFPVPPDLPPGHLCLSHPPSLILLLAPSDHLFALFLHFPLLLAFSFPAEQKPQQLVCLPACLPSPGSTPSCPLSPPLPPSRAGRESWFYLFFCLFGKRAVAVLGPGCCVLPGAAGRLAVLASQECGRDAPRYIYSPPAAGPSRAEPGLPGGPRGARYPPSLSSRPHMALGPTVPSLSSDLL